MKSQQLQVLYHQRSVLHATSPEGVPSVSGLVQTHLVNLFPQHLGGRGPAEGDPAPFVVWNVEDRICWSLGIAGNVDKLFERGTTTERR